MQKFDLNSIKRLADISEYRDALGPLSTRRPVPSRHPQQESLFVRLINPFFDGIGKVEMWRGGP